MIRPVFALAFGIVATALFSVLGAAALRGLRTGQAWTGLAPIPLVRVSSLFALAFCVFAMIAAWWAVFTQSR